MTKVGIVGASGYTGIELIRILAQHPEVEITYLAAQRHAGQNLGQIYPHLTAFDHIILQTFNPDTLPEIDVLFLALPHGASHGVMRRLAQHPCRIIDLSADFRISSPETYTQWYNLTHDCPELIPEFVPGFPELYRNQIKSAKWVANPGCYATSMILGLYPLAKAGLITSPVISDAKSGVSGAGRAAKESSLYCEVSEGFSAYGTFVHRHTAEVEQHLGIRVGFSPHLVPMSRGILCTMYVNVDSAIDLESIHTLYSRSYENEPFIRLMPEQSNPGTQFVRGSNVCAITVKKPDPELPLVVFSALDNLIKGASGQAVQNMNIMLGFDEITALNHLPWYV